MADRIGFIGLGIMGSRMAVNLRCADHRLTVFNRTRSTADAWVAQHGGEVAGSPAALAAVSDVVITMVVDGAQVEQVLLGENGVAEGAAAGSLCIDCSTIGPAAARRIGAGLSERRLSLVDAPVTGSAPKAEDGTLTIMAGGAAADVERGRPLLEAMGDLVVDVGELGQGQMVKLINNAVAAANAATVGQALLLAKATGVDLDALERILGAGAGGSTMLALKAGPMRAHDYTTLFKLSHMLKDVRLCLEQAERAGVPFPAATDAEQTLSAAERLGHGDDDFAALIEALEARAEGRPESD
ncbi:MAG TPA: NAD(P)-dependent oxidoreductase [Solirubrobacteraceae bacterium]|nr:NAD(P)-dependent oxidoreductase [Solirubrobacteraceae bacterium]